VSRRFQNTFAKQRKVLVRTERENAELHSSRFLAKVSRLSHTLLLPLLRPPLFHHLGKALAPGSSDAAAPLLLRRGLVLRPCPLLLLRCPTRPHRSGDPPPSARAHAPSAALRWPGGAPGRAASATAGSVECFEGGDSAVNAVALGAKVGDDSFRVHNSSAAIVSERKTRHRCGFCFAAHPC
jgi:hypothetical protein